MQPMLNIALRAARLAGEQIARAAERLDLIKSENSSVTDFLNETASKAEQTIAYTLQKAYPAHEINGEFSGNYAAAEGKADVIWHINPIDSVTNFICGLPEFAICMAATHKGRVEHAVILNPMTGEEFTASRGHGAQLNGKRMRVTNQRELPNAIIATSYLNSSKEKSHIGTFNAIQQNIHEANGILLNTGSTALNIANTAAGRIDGFIQIGLQTEVLEAGSLLIQEAGGLLGDLNGGNSFRQHGNTVSANPKMFKSLLKALHGISE